VEYSSSPCLAGDGERNSSKRSRTVDAWSSNRSVCLARVSLAVERMKSE
jgi:hypothetical protein